MVRIARSNGSEASFKAQQSDPSSQFKRDGRQSMKMEAKHQPLYILMISIHGLIRGDNL